MYLEKTKYFAPKMGRRGSNDTSSSRKTVDSSSKKGTTRSNRRLSLEFLRQLSGRRLVAAECDETSICSSSASTLVPTPLPLLESEIANSSSSSPQSKSVSSVLSGQEANKFLEQVQSAVYQHQNRIGVLNKTIPQQVSIAKGRYLHGNSTGACLAMKKAKKMERERNLTIQAMNMAMDAVVEIQVAMHQASSRAVAGTNRHVVVRVDIGQHCKVLAKIQHLLLEKEMELKMSRKDLLSLVQGLV